MSLWHDQAVTYQSTDGEQFSSTRLTTVRQLRFHRYLYSQTHNITPIVPSRDDTVRDTDCQLILVCYVAKPLRRSSTGNNRLPMKIECIARDSRVFAGAANCFSQNYPSRRFHDGTLDISTGITRSWLYRERVNKNNSSAKSDALRSRDRARAAFIKSWLREKEK